MNELLTIVIPVKNEEKNLPECLENIKPFKYVVIVDSGSTDRTLAIAEEYGREVVKFKWNGEFPKKRNWILRNYVFKTPWVMFLDADERLTPMFCEEMERELPTTKYNAFICFYDNWFMERMLRHGDAMRKTAILRLGAGEYEKIEEHGWSNLDMEIHEHLQVKGEIGTIQSRLEHHDKRSLESYYKKHEEYASWEANRYKALNGDFSKLTERQRMKYQLINKWWFGFAYFIVCYFLKKGFLDGEAGYVFARGKWKYFSNIRKKILNGGE
jgi:glycosyltransferase involved in cell wall biosynthesis